MRSAPGPRPYLEPLCKAHRKLIGKFRSSNSSLTNYLKRFALRHQETDFLSGTTLAILGIDDKKYIAGFFSLAPVSVDRTPAQKVESLQRLPRFPIPGILLAQLAVDERARGQGLGRYLFEEALGRALRVVQDGPLRARLFVADAVDEAAVRFYEHFGMTRLAEGFPARMVLDLKKIIDGS